MSNPFHCFFLLITNCTITTLKKQSTTSSKGYLSIGDNKYEGSFPMKQHIKAGRYLLRLSLEGSKTERAVRIEYLIE